MSALQYSFIENSESKNTERPTIKESIVEHLEKKAHKKKPSSKIDNLLNSSISKLNRKVIERYGYGGRTQSISTAEKDDNGNRR